MGYDETVYQSVLKKFQRRPFEEIACFPDYKVNGDLISFDYLDHQIGVTHPEGFLKTDFDPELELSLSARILILQYLAKHTGKGRQDALVSYKDLLDGSDYKDTFMKRSIRPLVNSFGSVPENLIKAAHAMRGCPNSLGDVGVTVEILPACSIALVIWKGDKDFPPAGTILFGEPLTCAFNAEDCVELASLLVERLEYINRRY